MAFEDRELAGVLFRNKKTSDKQPDWRGTLLVNGEAAEIALWEKEGRKGRYFSFNISPAREKRADPGAYVPAPLGPDDDDIPF